MRTLASILMLGAGAYAYSASMDRKTRKRWKRRMNQVNFSFIEDLMPRRRTLRRMRRQMTRAFS
ncbi:hypothetical protein K8O68_00670 [Salipaludibacillus sp. CUR1]|uniref:hypothetical protein n=1 Tax=Salipaludibacillus sp. CUR1 TaxID=2820003 RepID=UPI001E4BE28C|nr:hypothetical protein [Salipaludibacillus sp. CUR1]MCE7790925.1 hypothetical protein [Salipaludibacillus sp. CUR1]